MGTEGQPPLTDIVSAQPNVMDILSGDPSGDPTGLADYVVLRQDPRDDSWYTVVVNMTADSPEEAIEKAAIEKETGEGRYVAFPNVWWRAQNVTVKKIAEVEMEAQEMV